MAENKNLRKYLLDSEEIPREKVGSLLNKMIGMYHKTECPTEKLELFTEVICLVLSSIVNDPKDIFYIIEKNLKK